MDMALLVSRAHMAGRAPVGVGGGDLEDVFIHVIAMRVMHMAVVEIVSMSAVRASPMTAGQAMLMGVILMLRTCAHNNLRIWNASFRRYGFASTAPIATVR